MELISQLAIFMYAITEIPVASPAVESATECYVACHVNVVDSRTDGQSNAVSVKCVKPGFSTTMGNFNDLTVR